MRCVSSDSRLCAPCVSLMWCRACVYGAVSCHAILAFVCLVLCVRHAYHLMWCCVYACVPCDATLCVIFWCGAVHVSPRCTRASRQLRSSTASPTKASARRLPEVCPPPPSNTRQENTLTCVTFFLIFLDKSLLLSSAIP